LQEEIHCILDLEEMWYKKKIQAEEQYRKDLSHLKASEELLSHTCHQSVIAHQEASCMEDAVRMHGHLMTYGTVCCQHCQRSPHNYQYTGSDLAPSSISGWGG